MLTCKFLKVFYNCLRGWLCWKITAQFLLAGACCSCDIYVRCVCFVLFLCLMRLLRTFFRALRTLRGWKPRLSAQFSRRRRGTEPVRQPQENKDK